MVEDAPAPPPPEDLRERRRRQLLSDISSFLLTHRLELSGYTLTIAHDVMTGCNPKLAWLIERRVEARMPITLEWLEEAARNSGRNDGAAALTTMMGQLETTIAEFAQTATAARTATSEYSTALEAHVGDLRQVTEAGAMINELAVIARDMLSRTREIEIELTRSEEETRTLQKSLAEARREAEMDHLTGLPNRRAFESTYEAEFASTRESGEPLCVAFCDIDHFKRINDTHGHEAGDRVLRTVAKALAKISGDKCHVARHGGEEFVVLLRGRDVEETWNVLDDAREAMAARKLVNRATDIPFGRITFSAGIADVHAYDNPREALKAADDALYAAKNAGRNCVLKARDLPPDDI
ncbi:GGDEF domain-containing protein [Novosphingobium album (ex Liu et al. 2023)]|uniref:diguanylate cyclase n=1 Tax=Novosphingobium album (ex Liu et al. 2023) TaxID=3031130 RepID=A0ABT5WSM9_9SPHN|nr:GGDEF domain-containing protein [Novosphingobium album (ex Liu et al. 2023)]MDE8653050.1 GGDEF domain-containing protein [Novosphingobium album (ex Liu et al. 2023)]